MLINICNKSPIYKNLPKFFFRNTLETTQKVLILKYITLSTMSQLENLVYSAYEHGKRDQLFIQVGKLRQESGGEKRKLEDIYQEAYDIVMKT
jgi:hypothetical protein